MTWIENAYEKASILIMMLLGKNPIIILRESVNLIA